MTGRQRFITAAASMLSLAVILFLSSCTPGGGSGLRRHDLFNLPLGTLPGELDWFYREGYRMAGIADIQTRDGLVYISGGGAGKVMVFNSYGDLLTYVYDSVRNPAPAVNEDGKTNSLVTSWPFRKPVSIAPFDGGFMVSDGVAQERQVLDNETGVVYDQVVLRFNQEGEYLGHLGREGFGGSPFPNIYSIDVRQNGDIVVSSRVPGVWMSYWYNSDGYPLATVKLLENQMPGLEDGGNITVYSVRPDPVEMLLHIRLDVYPAGSDLPEPRLYTLNLSTLEYGEPLILDYNYNDNSGKTSPEKIPVPPVYLGTTIDGTHMLISPEGADFYRLILLDFNGRIVQNRRLKVDSSASIYRHFRMQNNGLLTGIFFGPQEASVSWWRVDKLVGNER